MTLVLDMMTARLFIAVVEEGSIARAARRECIAPSAISKRISEVEQRLNVTLLRRHVSGVEMTAAGAVVLRRGRNLLHEAGQLEVEIQQLAVGIQGHIRVAAGETTLIASLPTVLGGFLRDNPGIRVDLDERLHDDVVRAVQEGTVDLGILAGEILPADLWVGFCYRDQLVAVMPRNHALADYPGVTMSEMLDHDIIGQDRRGALGALLNRQATALGRSMRVRVRADGYDVVCRLAEEGLGIGVVAESSARLFASQMELASLPILDAWARRQHRVCVRRPEELSHAARLLLERLLQEARPEG